MIPDMVEFYTNELFKEIRDVYWSQLLNVNTLLRCTGFSMWQPLSATNADYPIDNVIR